MVVLIMTTDFNARTGMFAAPKDDTNFVNLMLREKSTHPVSHTLSNNAANINLSTTRTALLLSPLALAACGGNDSSTIVPPASIGGEGEHETGSIVYDNTIRIRETYQTTSWQVTEMSDGFWYAGLYIPPAPAFQHPKNTIPVDIDNDGDLDLIVPSVLGYRSGVDSRKNFIVLENVNGTLEYSQEKTDASPFTAGAARTAEIYLQAYDASAFVTVNIGSATETEEDQTLPWFFGDLTITLLDPYVQLQDTLIKDITLPMSAFAQRATAVNAHSLAIGDVNRDGLDDILVGELSGVFALLQNPSGTLEIFTSDFFTALTNWAEPELGISTTSFLLDLHMNDFNSDGLDDIVVGWGHNPSLSRLFFNSSEGFSVENSVTLPEPVYGSDNIMHLNTFSGDFSNDGTQDIIVVHTRFDPWYGGNYLQYLRNDGSGNFIDETDERLVAPGDFRDTFGDRLEGHSDSVRVIDFDFDGDLDIVGSYFEEKAFTVEPFIFINDGTGHFTLVDLPIVDGFGPYSVWADFDNDGVMELLTYHTDAGNFFEVYVFEDTLNSAVNSLV